MAAQAESSRMAQARVGSHPMRSSDDVDSAVADTRVSTVPRSFAGETANDPARSGKLRFKERVRDTNHVEESLLQCENGPRYREISPGISMHCTATQKSPFEICGKFFYAVTFDDSTFVNDVVFDNCVFINVSFKGCILSDARFINVFLQDMEFVGCDFNDTTWLSRGEFDQTWNGRTFEQVTFTGDRIPDEVGDPAWLERMMGSQIVPDRVETEPVVQDEILIHQSVGRPGNSTSRVAEAVNDQDAEPGVYDFSKLGNMVYHSYNGDLDEETRLRKLSEWEVFAQEQDVERKRKREEEELQQAMAQSLEEAAAAHNLGDENETAPRAADPGTSTNPSQSAAQKNHVDPFASLLSSVKADRQPGQAPSRTRLPPLLETFRPAAPPIAPLVYDENEDDLEELVYRPASRFGR